MIKTRKGGSKILSYSLNSLKRRERKEGENEPLRNKKNYMSYFFIAYQIKI